MRIGTLEDRPSQIKGIQILTSEECVKLFKFNITSYRVKIILKDNVSMNAPYKIN